MEINTQLNKGTVCAVVVTYNRRELLRSCLQALLAQTRPLDEIIVVDNAATDGTDHMIFTEFPEVTYLRLPENTGGAKGFHEGMKLAYEKGYAWIWIMDDDSKAALDCLEHLFARNAQANVLTPVQIDSIGRRYGQGLWRGRYVVSAQLKDVDGIIRVELFSFVGPLISRMVVEMVGFPRDDFFIYADDYEYSLRIRSIGLKCIAVLDAVIYHDLGGKPIQVKRLGYARERYPQEAWKFYYDTRNTLIMLQHLGFWERLYAYPWWLYLLLRSTIGNLLYEPDWRKRLGYRWLGIQHGIKGITGKRVDPDHF